MCLRSHWTQDGHAVPSVGFSVSRNHYLKDNNNKEVQECIDLMKLD